MDNIQSTGMPVAPEGGSSKKLWVVGAIILVVLIGGYLILGGNSNKDDQGILVGDDSEIVVNEQNPDSVAVLIQSVSVRTPGYVAILENNGGVPGKIIGISALFAPGTYKNASVIAPLKPGVSYFAVLLADDGNGLFDAKTDTTYIKNASGKDIIKEFKVGNSTVGGEDKG
jgi:hypothetical protein